ncbi:hypothetical protein DD238_007448 [Peronospora effusa]|uniref:Uncharacterized protein n=1 Tax=Peronospora effusa TaxID=542832 RepID=A0A3M6VCR8_9STRA|nr:hypothetical protein DD238_007448 [Peronospora effusa]
MSTAKTLHLAETLEIKHALAYNSGLRRLSHAYNAVDGLEAVGKNTLLLNNALLRLNMNQSIMSAQDGLAIASSDKIYENN